MGVGYARAALAGLAALTATGTAAAEESQASRAARWHDVAAAIFPGRTVQDGSALMNLDAPPRAMDAALVPVSISVQPSVGLKSLTLVVDDNPAPVAGRVNFGPLADPHLLRLRVRVDQYTLLHAVAELQDGSLVSVARFIKAAGGCSAPGSADQAEALTRIGRMKLRIDNPADSGTQTAELLISHPNSNGMQMNPVTRLYTPARYVQTVRVSQGGQNILVMDGDISLAQDPAITFAFHPAGMQPVDVEVDDSAKSVFRQSFPLGAKPS